MNKEVKILTIFVVLAFLLGVAGTTISLVNNRLIRNRVIKPARFLALQGALATRRLPGEKGRVTRSRTRIRPGKEAVPGGEVRERLRELVKRREEKERRYNEMLKNLQEAIKRQNRLLKELSRKMAELEEKVE